MIRVDNITVKKMMKCLLKGDFSLYGSNVRDLERLKGEIND